MNAIFGALLVVGGMLFLVEDVLADRYRLLLLPVLLVTAGTAMLLRHHPDDDTIDLRDRSTPGANICVTCRGAGTVYSAEWNDWRRCGPVRNIRELCPSCEGLSVSGPPT